MSIFPIVGMPGVRTARETGNRLVFRDGTISGWFSQGRVISGSVSRDPGNTGNINVLRAGNLMGKITSGGKYAPSVLGVTTGALTSVATSVSMAAAVVTELVRRVGATGTFKLTGPPTANGTVRTLTATYSATGATTATITALGVNEVQTVNLSTAATGGNLRLLVQKTDGTLALTPNVAWSATDATLLSNLQTALDTATGVVNGIVATAISAVDTDLGFVLTYSGTGYAANTWALAQVDTLFTSNTGANVVRTTTGVDGRFVAGSFVQPTDGSETPLTFIPDGTGILVTDQDGTSSDVPFPDMPIAGVIQSAQLLPAWPSDTSLRAWVVAALSSATGGKFVFDHLF